MKSGWPTVIALALVALISVLVLRGRAERAEAAELRWHAHADSVAAWARDTVQAAQDSRRRAIATRDSAIELASVVQSRVDTLRIRTQELRLIPVPDTCREAVAVRDLLLAHYDSAYVAVHQAHQYQLRATMRALHSQALYAMAYDSVSAVLDARPRPRGRWSPRLSAVAGVWDNRSYDALLELRVGHVEVAGGLCDGRRCGRVGVRFPLF